MLALLALISLAALACNPAPGPSGPEAAPERPRADAPPAAGPPASAPEARLAELGQKLFFDPRLSGDNTVSCASCHDPALAFSDGKARALGRGGRQLERNTPGLLDIGRRGPFFWDGRAATLEEQALGPVASEAEMGQDLAELPRELGQDPAYAAAFAELFGSEGPSPAAVGRALAAYERTLASGPSAHDRRAAGDAGALGAEAERGMALFFGKAECFVCHRGELLTDLGFHRVNPSGGDEGRSRVDGDRRSRGAFKTPSLRSIRRTAPYFHDGSAPTLRSVVDHYARGGRSDADDSPRDIHPLDLSETERAELVAFLEAL